MNGNPKNGDDCRNLFKPRKCFKIGTFYCVNTSYPMDNCFTGRRDRSRQMTEKVILYKLSAGPFTECTFARCRLVHTSCLDRMTSSCLFRLARGVYRRVLQSSTCSIFKTTSNFHLFSIIKNFYCFWSSYGISWTEEGSCGHIMALFDSHSKCAQCREKGIGQDPCVEKKPCQICDNLSEDQKKQLATPSYRTRKELQKKILIRLSLPGC